MNGTPIRPSQGVVFKLIFVNVGIFAFQALFADNLYATILEYFALTPAFVVHRLYVWQIFTYMFLHGNLWHIFFNMYALLIFGIPIEQEWGSRRFLLYYFFTGIGAGISIFLINLIAQGPGYVSPTLGASGAVFGLLLAFGILYPNVELLLFFILPIKAKHLVILYGILELIMELSSSSSQISHVGHLGGLLFGIIYFLVFRKRALSFKAKIIQSRIKKNLEEHSSALQEKTSTSDHNSLEYKVNILKKLKLGGPDALTGDEYQFVNYMRIMMEGRYAGCDEREFSSGDDHCRRCPDFDACFLREIKKYL